MYYLKLLIKHLLLRGGSKCATTVPYNRSHVSVTRYRSLVVKDTNTL